MLQALLHDVVAVRVLAQIDHGWLKRGNQAVNMVVLDTVLHYFLHGSGSMDTQRGNHQIIRHLHMQGMWTDEITCYSHSARKV